MSTSNSGAYKALIDALEAGTYIPPRYTYSSSKLSQGQAKSVTKVCQKIAVKFRNTTGPQRTVDPIPGQRKYA
ncbi:hypothetical protein MMC29_001072 [Sticta canariensis]|nr:hypothetical protein [Sticta canariensis]